MLEINNYNSTILHNISFSLKENENLIILGENGAGKSTLAKVLSIASPNNFTLLFEIRFDKTFARVDFPAPFSPRIIKFSFCFKLKLILCKMVLL